MKRIFSVFLSISLLAAAGAFADQGNGSIRITSGNGSAIAGVVSSGTTATGANGLTTFVARQGTVAPGAGNLGLLGLDSSGNLSVNCVTGCSAGGSFTDNSAFTAGTTPTSNVGGVYNDSLGALTSGNAATARMTPNRALHSNLRNQSGTELASLTTTPTGSELALVTRNIPSGTQTIAGTAATTLGVGLATFGAGQQAVTASAVALATNTSKAMCARVLGAGTQPVYIGTSGVTTATGYELSPGDSQCWPISNTNLMYVIAPGTGSTISYDFVN